MIVDKKLKNYFINLMISEDQAIGIYEAELFLNISPKDIFQNILLEEISHERELIRIIDEMNWKLSRHQVLLIKLNRILGWGIGILLSIIPKRLCFIFHQTGEIKAANDYIKLKSFIDQHNNFESFSSAKVKTILDKIIENEKLHSYTFRTLLANYLKEK
jgi:rubrerythrin